MEIRTKDRLFLLVAVPVAAAAGYCWLWRSDAVKQIDTLERRCAALVEKEDFPLEKKRAERELGLAGAELEKERKIETRSPEVVAERGENAAERERTVLAVFRESGLAVRRGEIVKEPNAAAATLKATGLRPKPVVRRYTLEGRYPQLVRALELFASRKLAVIVASIAMGGGDRGRWILEVTL